MYAHACNESQIFVFYRDITHASQPTLGFSITNYFRYLQTKWEELSQYELLSDFLSDGVVESKLLDRRHTYQFLKLEFEALLTQILNTSPLPSLYEAFTIVDGDERRLRLLPFISLLESSSTSLDQRAFATSSRTHPYCQHYHKLSHLIDCYFDLNPKLKLHSPPPSDDRRGGHSGGFGRGTPRTGAIAEVEPIPTNLPNFNQI